MNTNKDRYDFNDAKLLMERLRSPINGCPWDREQTFDTIKKYTVEEAYEVADAIERGTMDDLKDELGDLLFQILFHAQMASENDDFSIDDVIDHITKKMIFRHPHVFGDEVGANPQDIEERIWQEQKEKEKATKSQGSTSENSHYLDDVTLSLPALLLANKIQKRVRKIGFKFDNINGALDKLQEEITELKQAINNDNERDIEDELGDVLFASSLLGAHLKIDPENALRQANLKFINRFNAIEDELREIGKSLENSSITDMETAWIKIKNKKF